MPAEVPHAKTKDAKVPSAKTKYAGVAVVCAKCAKRQGLRSKDVRALVKDACRDLFPAQGGREKDGQEKGGPRKGKRRRLCIVESGCLGPCPKRAIAVATGGSLAAGRVLLLDPAAGRDGVRAALLPEFGPIARLAGDPNPAGPGDGSSRSP